MTSIKKRTGFFISWEFSIAGVVLVFLILANNKNKVIASEELVSDIDADSKTYTIIIDLLLEVYRNTDFDNEIGLKCHYDKEDISSVQDKRQYREGYIAAIKKMINDINVEDKKRRLLNNQYTGKLKIESHSFSTLCDSSPDSCCYSKGRSEATKQIVIFRKRLSNEIKQVSEKHFNDDYNNYRKKGMLVPDKMFTERIKETPYLQAVIFLQKKFKEKHKISSWDNIINDEISESLNNTLKQ